VNDDWKSPLNVSVVEAVLVKMVYLPPPPIRLIDRSVALSVVPT
jgi:hypothetical protein